VTSILDRSSVRFWHQTLAQPRKKRCLAVRSSIGAWFFSGEYRDERRVGDPHAVVVGGVFAEREFAVEFQVVDRGEAAVRISYAAGAPRIFCCRRRSTSPK
jgi:hypothetical protein